MVEGCQAGWLGHLLAIAVYARVQCREPKTGQERVQFYCEDDILFLFSYYLSMMEDIPRQDDAFTVLYEIFTSLEAKTNI